jgi:hypothetical protein
VGIQYGVARWALNCIGHRRGLLRILREELGIGIAGSLGDRVRYGPLKGSILSKDETFSIAAKAVKVLGLYEQPVQRLIGTHGPFGRGLFVGAADGYYGIGTVAAGLVQSSYCWDIDPRSQAALTAAAARNGVSERVRVFGAFDEGAMTRDVGVAALSSNDLVMVDIEGGEFDFLSDRVLQSFGSALVVVELHPLLVENGAQRVDELIRKTKHKAGFRIMTDEGRSLAGIKEVSGLNDDERNLLCSEGRGFQMSWLVFGGRVPADRGSA